MLLFTQVSLWEIIKTFFPILIEIIGLILIFIEIKFPQVKKSMDQKLQNSFEFYLYSSNSEWGERMKYYWSVKSFKNAEGLYEKTVFIFAFLMTWIIPIIIIALYFLKVHKYLFPIIESKIVSTALIIFLINFIWFIYALFLVGPIRFVINAVNRVFNGNVLGGLGFIFALCGLLMRYCQMLCFEALC